jgi:hypothetical protein
MYIANTDIKGTLEEYSLKDATFLYYDFAPRLYNFCLSLGFESGKILPSRAFCSDENQGYPNILLAKHFGTIPFNHGKVGGLVATDLHDPHSEHGKDLVIIHASHVGYDPETCTFGSYHRKHTEHFQTTSSCGKMNSVLKWYMAQYAFAKKNIFLHREDNEYLVCIDNQILNKNMPEGLFLHLDKFVEMGSFGNFLPRKAYSTSTCYTASQGLRDLLGDNAWPIDGREPIGENLLPELFGFKRHISGDSEIHGHLEKNLISPMPWIVSSKFPLLTAAQSNTQVEFERTYRSLVNAEGYKGKRVLLISGLNIDISPHENQVFPLTTFVPWAAFVQEPNDHCYVMEQREVVDCLLDQKADNPDEVYLETAIQKMKETRKIEIKF